VTSFDEYCPIAMGVEVIGDRWTPLILRELIVGCTRFNDIHRGVPRMSRTLLSQRLRDLQRHGVVTHEDGEYRLTPKGEELHPVIWGLGLWASKWCFDDPTEEQLDAQNLVWRMHQFVVPEALPARRTTVEIQATGEGSGRHWLVVEDGAATACRDDPGYEVDLLVRGDNAALHRWFMGRSTWREVTEAGLVRLDGPATLVRSFPRWFSSAFGEAIAAAR